MNNFLGQVFWGNSILSYFICIGIFVVAIAVIGIFKRIITVQLKKWARKTPAGFDDAVIRAVEKTLLPLLYFGAFYLAIRPLTLNPGLAKVIDVLGLVLLTIFGVRFILAIIAYAIESYWAKKEEDVARKQGFAGILTVIKVVVWGLAIVVLLDNLGIKISALIAGIGIGGVAIALAAQAILGDLFSYFAIFFDKPFEIGDFIIVGDFLGTIEHIGIKTTRVRSLGGEQLVFSNADLTGSRIRNYKRMQKRRVVFRFGVTYQTTQGQLKEIPGVVKKIIEGVKDTVFDRAHFFEYGNFSLVFEVVYYVMSADYNVYMDVQQEINFKLKSELEKRGVEFAYPTQTLYMQKTTGSNVQ